MGNSTKKSINENNRKVEVSDNPDLSVNNDRRNFLKKAGLGGLSLAGFMLLSIEETIAQVTSKVNRSSNPSDLKITDLRYVTVMHLGRPITLIRIYTNQDLYGLGEVRDGADKRYALMLKSRLLGQNPSNVERIFKLIKQHGGHGRDGGGVSGVEMALWDLAGKAYGVPVWMLLGGKYRDRVRLYADTHGDTNIELIKEKVSRRINEEGFTWIKMTRLFNLGEGKPGSYLNSPSRQLTEEGIEKIVAYIETIRNLVGNRIPISTDHFGDSSVNNIIRLGKALEPYRLAWMEEPVSWRLTNHLKMVKDSIDTPIATGENIYLKETFIELCDAHAIDIVHPDLATAGGILETKKIGDYAQEKGIGMAQHYAGTPISFMANVHCAAATDNAAVLEFHSEAGEQITNWTSMARRTDNQPLLAKGYANVPDTPGLGIELNEANIKRILNPKDQSFFATTNEWDEWDR
jgi:L-alanine-DL-glutamate epimerase-like enolase superfamily enzyme